MAVVAAFDTYEETVTESGSDTVVSFSMTTDAGSGWIPCGPYYRATLVAEVDTNGTDVTVEGIASTNASTETISAKATYASGTRRVLDAESVEGYAYIRIKSDGTEADSNSFYLLLK